MQSFSFFDKFVFIDKLEYACSTKSPTKVIGYKSSPKFDGQCTMGHFRNSFMKAGRGSVSLPSLLICFRVGICLRDFELIERLWSLFFDWIGPNSGFTANSEFDCDVDRDSDADVDRDTLRDCVRLLRRRFRFPDMMGY